MLLTTVQLFLLIVLLILAGFAAFTLALVKWKCLCIRYYQAFFHYGFLDLQSVDTSIPQESLSGTCFSFCISSPWEGLTSFPIYFLTLLLHETSDNATQKKRIFRFSGQCSFCGIRKRGTKRGGAAEPLWRVSTVATTDENDQCCKSSDSDFSHICMMICWVQTNIRISQRYQS